MRAPLTALLCLTAAVSAYGQQPVSSAAAVDAPAHIAFIEGAVDVVHDGVAERADPPVLLVEGDIVRTANGRAEIVFGDGTLLYLDHSGELEVLAPDRLRLLEGRVIVRVSAAARSAYVLDTPGGSVRLDGRGEFGVTAARSARLEVRTARGLAAIDTGTQRVIVRAGEMATLAGPGARADFQAYNSARWDDFTAWANERANGSVASESASHVPSELRVYGGVLDAHGRWEHLNPYGYVWYPAVATGWRPYYDGAWAHTRYGWTWHGRDRWAWPTHHYGRWGFNGIAWYWIPASGWGPAWVSWGVTTGYVSWAPLGWNGLPSIGLWPRRDHPAYAPRYDPWRGWTVVPRHQFGPRRPIRPRAIDGNRLDAVTRGAMIHPEPRAGRQLRARCRVVHSRLPAAIRAATNRRRTVPDWSAGRKPPPRRRSRPRRRVEPGGASPTRPSTPRCIASRRQTTTGGRHPVTRDGYTDHTDRSGRVAGH